MTAPVNGRRQYRSGTAFERTVRADLEANGYRTVRAAGSHGIADLVALKPGQVLLVQCKTDGSLPPKPWNELYGLALECGAVPVLAERPARGQLRYWRLQRRKHPRERPQPREPFVIDEVIAQTGDAR